MFVVDSCRGQCCDKQRDAKDSNTLVTLQRGGFFASAIFYTGGAIHATIRRLLAYGDEDDDKVRCCRFIIIIIFSARMSKRKESN